MVPGIKQWGMQCVIEASSRRTVYCRAVWGRQGRLLHSRRVFLAEDLVDVNTVNEVSMADGGGLCWVKWLGSDKVLLLLLLSFSPPNLILLYFPVLHSHFFLPLPLKLWHGTALAFSLTRSALCRAPSFHCGLHLHNFLAQPDSGKAWGCAGGELTAALAEPTLWAYSQVMGINTFFAFPNCLWCLFDFNKPVNAFSDGNCPHFQWCKLK